MTMLGMIDYGLIVLFFIGVTALILVIAYAPAHEAASQAVPPPQKAKEAYTFLAVLFILLIAAKSGDEPLILDGYSATSSQTQRSREEKFRAIPNPANLREYMQHLSARPHHVGSPYDKQNAEWIRAKFQEFGFDAKIETFYVLFPTPKERVVELVAPTKFVAKLQEPAVPQDPTSNQQAEQLPTYNAYSADGDVTAPLIYVNYGMRDDYEELDRRGVSVKGAIVIARYGGGWRGIKPKVASTAL